MSSNSSPHLCLWLSPLVLQAFMAQKDVMRSSRNSRNDWGWWFSRHLPIYSSIFLIVSWAKQRFKHVILLFNILSWLPATFRIKYKFLRMVYKPLLCPPPCPNPAQSSFCLFTGLFSRCRFFLQTLRHISRDLFVIRWTLHGASLMAQRVKNPPASAGDVRDLGLIPGSGRSSGGEHGNPLQYSYLENPMDWEVWQATGLDMTEWLTLSLSNPLWHFLLCDLVWVLFMVLRNTFAPHLLWLPPFPGNSGITCWKPSLALAIYAMSCRSITPWAP